MLKIHNTLTGRKELFEPLVSGTVRMYVCGVTVYDECHIGHARSAFVFDVVRRYLEHSGFSVTFVKNFTDVDDKIIKRANELGKPWQEITATYIDAYYRDMGRLGIKPATVEPKATEHMAEIIGLVQVLLTKGAAYQVNGDVYFQVERYGSYGRLSKRKLDDMQAGARVEVDERKRHPMDFALWKGAKSGEPAWPSPWGPGRPGWHIECSAMSMKHLGETFDIHGGGADLIFPHHENEIAQSCAATGKEFARYWLHNGFVQINQEKMSKSLGNFFTIREIFEKWRGHWSGESFQNDLLTAEVLRYFLLATHYRSPLDFSDIGLEEARNTLNGFYGLFQRLEESAGKEEQGDVRIQPLLERFGDVFGQAMDDDFNTPVAIAEFQRLRSEVNKLLGIGLSRSARVDALGAFRRFGEVLGLFQLKKWQFNVCLKPVPMTGEAHLRAEAVIVRGSQALTDEEIERQLADRLEARKRKDFAKADAIREALEERGIIIEDRPDGTSRWKR
ncbi:MAG: cysteine--tRNA ligase [Nitrospirae bacterium]|nr:MAG: cysteine--tRNA ligase [Nitrospirota bacterium]